MWWTRSGENGNPDLEKGLQDQKIILKRSICRRKKRDWNFDSRKLPSKRKKKAKGHDEGEVLQ